MAFSTDQKKVLSILPHITGPISFLGSSWIIYEILSDRKKWKKPYHRLLLIMSLFDAASSLCLGLSTWPIPRESAGYATLGTQATCSAQAFFIHANIASPMYNFCLSWYYVLLVKYAIPEDKIRTSYEPWMHGVTITFALGTSVICLALEMFNDSSLWCWINALPKGCDQSYNSPQANCTRGDNAEIFRWAFFFAPLWAAILGSMILMFMLWQAVRSQEETSAKWTQQYKQASQKSLSLSGLDEGNEKSTQPRGYDQQSYRALRKSMGGVVGTLALATAGNNADAPETIEQNNDATADSKQQRQWIRRLRLKHQDSIKRHRKSNMVKNQAFRYVAMFWITWLPGSLNRVMQLAGHNIFWIMVLHAIFVPLQGALNCAVYKYPVFYQWRRNRQKRIQQEERQRRRAAGEGSSHAFSSEPWTRTPSSEASRRFSGIDHKSFPRDDFDSHHSEHHDDNDNDRQKEDHPNLHNGGGANTNQHSEIIHNVDDDEEPEHEIIFESPEGANALSPVDENDEDEGLER